MEEFALLQLEEGGFGLGLGPFKHEMEPPRSGEAFYINDFQLSDPRPWKIPASFEVHADFPTLGKGPEEVEVEWDAPAESVFRRVFQEVQSEIAEGRAQKLVPVVTERGTIRKGTPSGLLPRLAEAGDGLIAYGCHLGGADFVGATPERFLGLGPAGVETMALAGTVRAGSEETFKEDPKEIREHELVVEYLENRLSAFGSVARGARKLLALQGITHFFTPIRAHLHGEANLQRLIEWLHPTPAVGHLPHEAGLLAHLRRLRDEMGCPTHFGAPFGLLRAGEFQSVVLIRGLFRVEGGVGMPSGCGVIAESDAEKEWAELALKREAVRRFFSL